MSRRCTGWKPKLTRRPIVGGRTATRYVQSLRTGRAFDDETQWIRLTALFQDGTLTAFSPTATTFSVVNSATNGVLTAYSFQVLVVVVVVVVSSGGASASRVPPFRFSRRRREGVRLGWIPKRPFFPFSRSAPRQTLTPRLLFAGGGGGDGGGGQHSPRRCCWTPAASRAATSWATCRPGWAGATRRATRTRRRRPTTGRCCDRRPPSSAAVCPARRRPRRPRPSLATRDRRPAGRRCYRSGRPTSGPTGTGFGAERKTTNNNKLERAVVAACTANVPGRRRGTRVLWNGVII